MPRETSVPAQTVREEIRSIEEHPGDGTTPGLVRVTVGRIDDAGQFIVPQQFLTYVIEGPDYVALTGPANPDWGPGKPEGTYRNEDLWHFIDGLQRPDIAMQDPAKKPGHKAG